MWVSGESNWPAWPEGGLRLKVNSPIFKDKKTEDAVTYHSWQWDITFPLLQLGWQASAAICLSFIARIPRGPGQESRWGCYPEWCPLDDEWALWHGNDIWCPEQGTLFPQARIRGECGQIWTALVTVGPDTPAGVSGKDPTGAYGGDEAGLLLWGPEPWILMHVGPQGWQWTSSQILWPAHSSPEVGKMGRSQKPPTPEDHRNWQIKHNSFSDIREPVSLPEVEGQSYLHCPNSYSRK